MRKGTAKNTTSVRLKQQLTARDASSAVENATKPDPLVAPLGSRITCKKRLIRTGKFNRDSRGNNTIPPI